MKEKDKKPPFGFGHHPDFDSDKFFGYTTATTTDSKESSKEKKEDKKKKE